MMDLFDKMPTDNAELFVIKRLDMSNRKVKTHSPLVRSKIHCFFFIEKGEALILIGEKSYFFGENECAIIPEGQVFSVQYYNNCVGFMGGFHTDYLNTDNNGNNLLRTFEFLRKWENHKVLLDNQRKQFVINIFERLSAEIEDGKNKNILKSYLTALLTELDEAYKELNTSENSLSLNSQLCSRFVELVFDKTSLSLPITYYAEKLNVSQAHLQKTIKTQTGKTPLTWINEAVLLETKIMLSHTDMPINEIAEKVGIHDSSYFARLFKRHLGETPVSYRKKIKSS